jgi:hypothetical protein
VNRIKRWKKDGKENINQGVILNKKAMFFLSLQ